MRKILFAIPFFFSIVALNAHAALFSLSGNHRFGSNWFYNLDTIDGKNPGASDSAGFLEHRLIVRPDIIVDERFSVRSEFSLISQNTYDTIAGTTNQQNGGAGLDSEKGNSTSHSGDQGIKVRAAYLKWNSDVGIFRAGRMHKGWGLGLLYDEGLNAEDDSATIVDRMSFEGQLGSLVLTAAFEKYEEGSLYQDIDDDEVYEGSVKYENEGAGASIGILYGRHIRSADTTSKTVAAGGYSSSNEFSIFGKKEWETFSLGGEFASVAYDKQSDVYGGLAQMKWNPGSWNINVDGLYSSATGNRAFLVNPNYRPFLILFKQSLGANVGTAGGNSRYGRGIGFDPSNTTASEKGAMLGKLGIDYNFKQGKYKLGIVGGYAQLVESNTKGKKLGYEADIHFDQQWYDNFKTSVTAGAFIPGDAFPGSEKVWGAQVRSYLNF